MKFQKILVKIDGVISRYLGLQKEETCPASVQIINHKLHVITTSSHKRYVSKQSWFNFNRSSLNQVTFENREKLGLAIGQAIGKKLIVSFDEVTIKK